MAIRDSEATRQRLLTAATADFAANGIAGARVDRIAADAGANKALIYAYFGDKLGLFTAVFRMNADAVLDALPFTPDDLPGYAVRLHDMAIDRPELIRLALWARLEGEAQGGLVVGGAAADPKLAAIAEAQAAGRVTTALTPADVLGMIVALALSWSPAGMLALGASDPSEAEHDRRRRALAEAVERIIRS